MSWYRSANSVIAKFKVSLYLVAGLSNLAALILCCLVIC